MEHSFIHPGKILSTYACCAACQALGMGGVMVKVGTDRWRSQSTEHCPLPHISPVSGDQCLNTTQQFAKNRDLQHAAWSDVCDACPVVSVIASVTWSVFARGVDTPVENHKWQWTAPTERVGGEFVAEETFQVSFEEYIRFSGGEEEKELQAEEAKWWRRKGRGVSENASSSR